MKKIYSLFAALFMCVAANAIEYVTYPAGPATIDEFNNEFVVEFTGATSVEVDEYAWIELKSEAQYTADPNDDTYWEYLEAYMSDYNLSVEGNKVHFSLANCISTLEPGTYYIPVYDWNIYVDGEDIAGTVFSFTIAEPSTGFNFKVYPSTTATIAPEDFVNNEVVLEFAEGAEVTFDDFAWLEMKNSEQYNADPAEDLYYDYVGAADAYDWHVEGSKLHISFFWLDVNATGTYYLDVPAGTVFADGVDQGAFTLTFNVSTEGQAKAETVGLTVENSIYHDFTLSAPEEWVATGFGEYCDAFLMDVYYDYVCNVSLEIANGKVVGHIPANIEAGRYILDVVEGSVVFNNGEGENADLMQEVTLLEGVADGISNVKADGKQTIYNINGQRQSGVQKGINIIGGKKYVVK